MKKWYLGVSIALSLSAHAEITPQQSYKDFKQQYQQEYKTFKTEYEQNYHEFKEKVASYWGDKTELSDADTYIHYSDDLQQRTIVDFADNTISVERLGDEAINTDSVKALLEELSTTSVREQAKKDPLLSKIDINSDQTVLAAWAPKSSVDDIIKKAEVSTSESTAKTKKPELGSSATTKRVQRMQLTLPKSNVLNSRAADFLATAQQQAQELNLPLELIMAVMEVESSFNPLAQSPIPAFGLMQIVPTTAGMDVNRFVFEQDSIPSTEVLFDPSQNIEFGGHYLAILRDRYLDKITNPESRLYCMIAAYNTGAGNVAKTFHPEKEMRISAAVTEINKLTPQQVYDRLEQELPYQETRAYMGKVRSAMQKY
jgi:membrane-bound lytic murein transglycosylase C